MLCVHRITKGENLVSEHATQGFEKHLVLAVLCRACPCLVLPGGRTADRHSFAFDEVSTGGHMGWQS